LNVFVDTSAIVAVLDREDSEHARANKIWDRLLDENSNLQTTNYVLIEVAALLQRRIGLPALRTFQDDIVPVLKIDWIDERRHTAGMESVLAASRRNLSIVDCVSFQSMRELGIRAAFCFDKHFREHGFETLP